MASLSLDFLVMKFEFLWAELPPLSTEPWVLSLLKHCKIEFTVHSFVWVYTFALVEFHHLPDDLVEGLTMATKFCRISAEVSRKGKSKTLNKNKCVPRVALLFYFFTVYSATAKVAVKF